MFNRLSILVVSLFVFNFSFAESLLLKNVQVVDPESETIEVRDVLIESGKISKIVSANSLKCDCQTLDLTGKFLVPGFSDMHTHAYGNRGAEGSVENIGVKLASQRMLYAGVTSFLDLFYPEDEILNARNEQRKGGFVGSEIYAAGPIFTCTNGHGTEYGVPTRVIDTPEDARREIPQLAAKKPDVLKFVYDHATYGGKSMPTMSLETLKEGLKLGQQHGIKTVVHVGTWQDVKDAVLAGATSVTHVPNDAATDEVLSLMVEKNVYWIPTLTVQTNLLHIHRDPNSLNGDLITKIVRSDILRSFLDFEKWAAWTKAFFKVQVERESLYFSNFKKAIEKNVKVMLGTDVGNVGTFVGYSPHTELKLMVQGGMTAWEALRAATIEPSRFLGNNVGAKKGKRANLVVLKESPVDNILNTEKIDYVIWQGRLIDRETLLKGSLATNNPGR